jgi:deoxyribodipyrimidine photolyase-related protein
MYIDAYDVFMIPNVFGMLCYAKITDKNHMMTKPYLCSSNYLKKMSNYKSSDITINNTIYKWDMIIDALYYNHINNYIEIFSKNYSTAIAAKRWTTFTNTKKKELLELSKMYIKWLYTD